MSLSAALTNQHALNCLDSISKVDEQVEQNHCGHDCRGYPRNCLLLENARENAKSDLQQSKRHLDCHAHRAVLVVVRRLDSIERPCRHLILLEGSEKVRQSAVPTVI